MATITVDMSDEMHKRLKATSQESNVSMNKIALKGIEWVVKMWERKKDKEKGE
jgi:hypothetical protein